MKAERYIQVVLGAVVAWAGLMLHGCEYARQLATPPSSSPSTAAVVRGPRVYVTDGVKGVYAVKCEDRQLAEQFPAVGGAGDVDLSPDGRYLYATMPKSDQVMVYEATGHPVGRIAVGGDPQSLVVVGRGREAWVANRGSRDVSVIDLAARRVKRQVPTGDAPWDLVSSGDDRKFWAALHDANCVAQFDAATGKEVTRVPVGLHPYHLARDVKGHYLYVTIYDENVIAVVDTRSREVVARVRTGEGPYSIATSRAGRVFVANLESGTMTVFTAGQWDSPREVRLGARPTSLAVSPDEAWVFATLEGEPRLLAYPMEALGGPSPSPGAPGLPSPHGTVAPSGSPGARPSMRGMHPSASPSMAPSGSPSAEPEIVEVTPTVVDLSFAPARVFAGGRI